MSWTRERPTGGPTTTSTSATMTTTNTPTDTSNIPPGLLESGSATLILRAERDANGRRVTWSEDVVDNEGLGRKSSKVCCIYRKPREFGESSSESSSSSSSGSDYDSATDSDSSGGPSRHPIRKPGSNATNGHDHDHDHDGPCSHDHSSRPKKPRRKTRARRLPSPNAYEKMPKYKKRGGPGTTTEVMKPSGGGT